MKKLYSIVFITLLSTVAFAQNILTEDFDDVATAIATGGWTQVNNSVPQGTEIWHDGIGLAVPPYNGTSFAEASFQSTDAVNTGNISNWLISPSVSLLNGYTVSFWTTSYNSSTYPDRLELRLNELNTTNVGINDTGIGDFTTLLLSVNPTLMADSSLYPQD